MKSVFKVINKYPKVAIFALAILVRVAYLVFFLVRFGLDTTSDAADYIQFAQFMQNQGFFVLDVSELRAHAGPGFPALIYLDVLFFDARYLFFTITTGLLFNSLIAVIIYKICHFLFQNNMIAFMAAIWAVFYVHYFRYVPFINKENLVFFLFPFSFYSIFRLSEQRNWKYLLFFTLPYLYLIHTDERYFFYLPFLLIIPVIIHKKNIKWVFGAVLIIILGMTPWLYRNYLVFERPVILTERTAALTDKILGYQKEVNPFRKDRPKDTYDKENIPGYEAITDSMIKGVNPSGHGFKHISTLRKAIAKGDTPYTYSEWEKVKYEFFELMRPVKFEGTFVGYGYRYMPSWKFSSNLVYGFQYGSLLLLLPIGVYAAFRKVKNRTGKVMLMSLLLILFIHIFVHLFIGHSIQRYRVPVDFVLIIFGMAALAWLMELVSLRWKENAF